MRIIAEYEEGRFHETNGVLEVRAVDGGGLMVRTSDVSAVIDLDGHWTSVRIEATNGQ